MHKPPTLSSTKTDETKDTSQSTEAISDLSLSCRFCGQSFSTSQSLKKHMINHRGEKPYSCLECGKGFKKLTHLLVHKRAHQRRIQCTVCKKILPTIRELIQHRSSHLTKGMLQCPDCNLQFQYPVYLLRHIKAHRQREIKAHKHLERSQKQSLEPVKEQGGAKQLQCSLCQEVFSDAHGLRKHCLTHIAGSLSHQCPFCEKHFPNRRGLLRHMNRHTGDKSFSCTNCGKQFYRDIYLQLHSEQCFPAQTEPPVTMESDNTPKPKRTHKLFKV
ncbi:zinc finger protein 774-like [Brachionichthys hirsutus]|uniref:zinc finger protein 774-like n=1 Tax=Brachionichthys hirsutus TaxID=412623 RepID=UPI003604D1C9